MEGSSGPKPLSVYLYIPNIIGYIRILMNCVAFALCFSNKKIFAILYFVSFVSDGLDGWLARKFNQVSTFGAVLDMVTDRVSTACLLTILSQIYRPGLIFLSLLALDIGSHWMQMYSTFLSGKASHKDVKDSTNWLFKAYYGHRPFMAFCCVGSEVVYIIFFLIAERQPESVINAFVSVIQRRLFLLLPFSLALFGWAIKQIINIIQMKTAADACEAKSAYVLLEALVPSPFFLVSVPAAVVSFRIRPSSSSPTSGEDDKQSVESSSGNPKTKPYVYTANEVETAEMDMVEMLIRSKDGLKISMAVLFWIALFFWTSVWNDKDGIKRNRRSWFRK